MEPLLHFLTNPIVLIFVVFYAILQFMMPFFIIRISIKCDKLENYLINQQNQKKQDEN